MIFEYASHERLLPASKQLAVRWLTLFSVLALEFLLITSQFEAPSLQTSPGGNDYGWAAWLFHQSKQFWTLGLWIIISCAFILSPRYKTILNRLIECSSGQRWLLWLAVQILVTAGFTVITSLIFQTPVDPSRFSLSWFSTWLVLASATLFFWLYALAPGQFWIQFIRQERSALFVGILLGICAWWIIKGMLILQNAPIYNDDASWNSLSKPTLKVCHYLLGLIYSDIVYQPENYLLGTTAFQVEVSYACSGIAGVSLITMFLIAYLWLFRKEFRFPQAYLLFPLGISVIWFANTLRIVLLIAIGVSYSPDIAVKGFHSQAGWIVFTLIAIAAISLSKKIRFFTIADRQASTDKLQSSLAAALISPLLVLMGTIMITSAFSSGFDFLYPIRVFAIALVLWYFRKCYRGLGWTFGWEGPAIGVAVFIIWMLLEPNADSSKTELAQGLAQLSSTSASLWLVFRVLGSVITVPLAEELAFRGYLIRKLIAKDFETVPLNKFTWLSFLVSSLLFGLLHDRWLAGTVAGMLYAYANYRRGQIGDAVIAHITTNALIAIIVLVQGRWALW